MIKIKTPSLDTSYYKKSDNRRYKNKKIIDLNGIGVGCGSDDDNNKTNNMHRHSNNTSNNSLIFNIMYIFYDILQDFIMIFMPMLRRRMKTVEIKYLLLWISSILAVMWYMNNNYDPETTCNRQFSKNGNAESDVDFVRLNDHEDLIGYSESGFNPTSDAKKVFPYNRNMPIIFVGGVPRSGTTLMRAMLDAHPGIRCGEETRIIPRLIYMRNQWTNSKKESERLKNAGITEDIIDSAIGAFILEVVVKHGKFKMVLKP